jgi:hypothetical protein
MVWSGPGDEGPEESITFIFGKLPVASNEQIRQAIFNFYSDNPKGDEMVHQSVALSNEPADAVDNDDAEMVVCDLGPQSPDQVDSFFDITYRIDLDASAGSGIAVSKLEAPALNHDTGGPLLETQPELLISPGVSMDKFGDEIEVPGGESGAALPRIGWEVIVSYQDSEPADPVYWPIGPLPE